MDEPKVEAAERSNRVIKTLIRENLGQIDIEVIGGGKITFNAEKASATNRKYAEFHGWKQRLVDDAAGEKTPQSKFGAIKGLVEYYESGANDWSQKRTAPRELTTEEKLELFNKLKAELGI